MFKFYIADLIKNKEISEGRIIPLSEISRESGVSRKTLINLKNNKVDNTSLRTLYRLCVYFDCDIADIVSFSSP